LTEVPGAEGSYFLHKMPAVLWLIAILSHWTVAQRVYYTWKMTQAVDVEASPSAHVSPPVRALSSAHSVAAAETRVEREAAS
jgi:CDP-diacylglycerol--glycerol-3-phosphate 3-phosphatidyltransferase